MKKKKFMAAAAAVAMAAITAFSVGNTPSVKAADVTDKPAIDIVVEGDYVEKSLSKADREAIANQLGYEYFGGDVVVCGSNTTAYIDWDNSSIPYWKAYDSFVLVPVLSRDDSGNLVIEKNEDGSLKTKINGALGWKGSKSGRAITYDSTSEFGKVTGKSFNILPKQYWTDNSNSGCINQNMGSREIGYNGVMADDAYIIRVYYTTDDLGNIQVASGLETWREDNTDTYGANISDVDDWRKYYTLENRVSAYVDYWFLPDGVSTVLNFADETPEPTPSKDNYTVDLGASQTISADTFAAILAENATKDVIIKSNNDVTFTFAKGTMTNVAGKTEYDFSTLINSTYLSSMPSYITSGNFISQIKFNYSGQLPATANIRIPVGTQYAGQTLYYSLMNEDNTFAEVQAVVVDDEGYITVKQSHCSSYVVTKTEPKLAGSDNTSDDNTANGGSSDNGNASNGGSSDDGNTSSTDNNSSSGNTATGDYSSTADTNVAPKTADMTPVIIYAVIAVAAMGAIIFVKRRKTA